MKPIRETIPLDEARTLVFDGLQVLTRVECVELRLAGGRVAGRDVEAAVDVPPFDRAAMDGYAVAAADTFGAGRYEPRVLRRVQTIFTGETPRGPVAAGECAEIATGAPMPDGADAVVMVEETERTGDDVRIHTPVYPRQNVGRRGADMKVGDAVVARGALLTPARVGAIAAVGIAEVDVVARPRVAILSTGNEVAEPGTVLAPGHIYDINRYTLESIVREHGGEPYAWPAAPDTIDALTAALTNAAADADIVVFSGGSSVGERDLILDVLQAAGEIVFHGIAVKPGKPTVFGRFAGKPVLGMPGYPTSCLSNAYMLLVPMLRHMAHLPAWAPRTIALPLSRRVVSTTGRHQFYTVRIDGGRAEPAFKASGDITSMAAADGYIEIPAQTDVVEAGEIVNVTLF
ncbi:MAG: molybdopterin molybdotransferase MoeA [Acidobacteriota bacterium]|nr:molybdopterin molybdotransferase MoeA [Acidobacteriota bacterium]